MSENIKIDIDALRSVASAAPRGRWSVWTSNSWRRVFSDQLGKHVTVVEPTKQPDGHVDLLFGAGVATFLETFTADKVLELLDEIARLRIVTSATVATLDLAMQADELAEFDRTVSDFEDNGETSTDYDRLMDWAQRGLLECTHFGVTKAGRDLLFGYFASISAEKAVPQSEDGSAGTNGGAPC